MHIPPLRPTIDRRTAQRRVLRQAATLTHGEVERQVTTWDVGAKGLCRLSAKPIAPGGRWQIRFDLPWGDQARSVTVDVKVKYSSDTGVEGFKIGAMLIDLTGAGADTLREFLSASESTSLATRPRRPTGSGCDNVQHRRRDEACAGPCLARAWRVPGACLACAGQGLGHRTRTMRQS